MARNRQSFIALNRQPLNLFSAVLAFYACVFLAWRTYHHWKLAVRLDTVKAAYYRYEFVELRLRTRDVALETSWKRAPMRARVLRDGVPITTIANLSEVDLRWDAARRVFIGKWPCPWNAPEGEYVPVLVDAAERGGAPLPAEIESRIETAPFRIVHRKPRPLPRRFVVLTMETAKSLAGMKIKAPDGRIRDWRGMIDWAEYVEADAFWILAGQTPGQKPGDIWVTYNFGLIPELARECRRRGLKFGVWEISYLTMSQNRLARYEYAQEVQEGRSVYTRAISLRDRKRPQDIADLLKRFRDVPEVDYLGLDYIRNALGGDELAEDFIDEMPGVRPPPEWERLTREERVVWFARKRIMRRDAAFIDAWQWWRAHRTALIVRKIKNELGDAKPLWAFTLTWDKGWHHGQDVAMFNDAGIDADALMLYEADAVQFDAMMRAWHSYVRRGDVQLLVGDVVDWPLHQRSPRGPGEFLYRSNRAAEHIYRDGPAAGLFIHDLERALWGRLGPYSTLDWMRAAREAARHFRSLPEPGTP
ncbi:MAG: hypothetical protein HY551_05835 [Elusimicrobia bacterium]|nr:hypothetical protein [Elusimicrobiota bacterium]